VREPAINSTPMATLDYFFTLMSPYAYLGHQAFLALARRHGATVRFRPLRLFSLFEATGGVPLGKRAPARQHYRFLELQRWREARGLPLNLRPRHFPTDPTRADSAAGAIVLAGGDPADFMLVTFRALWAEDRDIAAEATLADLLAASGHDARRVLDAADSAAVRSLLDGNTADAIAMDLPGVPGYAREGEIFWGQDRLDLLDRALSSGRQPFGQPAG
jgi:2-hydroxychromene-2-carboxylate isomerase